MPPTKPEPRRYLAPVGVQSVGSDTGHAHQVVDGAIECEECARALGWPAEGLLVEPPKLVNQAMAMNQ